MGQSFPRVQPEEKRRRNFEEVSLGYSKKLATDESIRCPQCADPVCNAGCPLGINIPKFIRMLREGNVSSAYETIKESNPLPSICGRICSAPCEAACVLTDENAPIGIRALERFASDFGRARHAERMVRKGKKVAIVGSGPAGLAAASELSQKGFQVTIFESLDKPGGVLRYGIPSFRVSPKTLEMEIQDIQALGVEIKTNFFIGRTVTIEDLKQDGFAAILLATGAGVPKFMELPGANLGAVYYGEEFLMRINMMRRGLFVSNKPRFAIGQKIAVIGSGNTALDCARAALRLERDVKLIFRRTEEDMRVRAEELQFAKEEGLGIEPLVRPIEILADQRNFVGGLKCVRMDYAATEEMNKWELETLPDSDFILDVDTVIIAIGHQPNAVLAQFIPGLKLTEEGLIQTDSQNMTTVKGVFAAGNVVTNAGPIVEAIVSGKRAAGDVEQYLRT